MSSVLIKVDKECAEKFSEAIRSIIDNNGCEGSPIYRRGVGADGKEFFSYVIYGDDSEKKELINNLIKNHDWNSDGITGFEIPKVISYKEYEVEMKPLGIIEFLD
jgi:hypothetical protein